MNYEWSNVRTINCENPDDFLNMISPRGPLFHERGFAGTSRVKSNVMVFRGHSDSKFKLIPSALRLDGPLMRFCEVPPETTADQIREEADLLRRFFSLADTAGLPLPEDSQTLRKYIANYSRYDYPDTLASSNATWPPNELLSLIAIAQHYGLPTRLLDWTRSYLTAAYFAAAGAMKELNKGPHGDWSSVDEESKLSVWAFDYSQYLDHRYSDDPEERLIESQLGEPLVVELITAPRAGNPNLHAQDGILSLFRLNHIIPDSKIDRRSLDVLVTEKSENPPSTPMFYEITLEKTYAAWLMWLLAKEGITASRLFPGYGGVVQCLLEENNL